MKRVRLGRAPSTTIAPLAALVATTAVAIAAAATSGLALCHHEVTVGMPMGSMPMGSMPMGNGSSGLDLCPVVIGLAVLALSLGVWSIAAFALERHRRVARHRLIGTLAALPPVRTVAGVIAVSALPVALVMLVDDGAPSSLETWLLLLALVVGGSLAATLFAIAAARVAVVCGRRLVLRIVRRSKRAAGRALIVRMRPRTGVARVLGAVGVLAAGLGLRAPPQFAR